MNAARKAVEKDIAWGISDVEQFVGLTRVNIWKKYRRGEFPAPWYVSRHRRWWRSDIVAWLEERVKATPAPTFGGGAK